MLAEQIAHLKELIPFVPVESQMVALRLISGYQKHDGLSPNHQQVVSELVREAQCKKAREFSAELARPYVSA